MGTTTITSSQYPSKRGILQKVTICSITTVLLKVVLNIGKQERSQNNGEV
jgi:hypothetical protein